MKGGAIATVRVSSDEHGASAPFFGVSPSPPSMQLPPTDKVDGPPQPRDR